MPRNKQSKPSEPAPLTVVSVPAFGTEDVLIDPRDQSVITATQDGAVWRISGPQAGGAAGDPVKLGATGGRPLGLEWLPDGRVLICDAQRGLLALDPGTGAVETLVTEVEGRHLRFCNNAAVAADGTIYFTDSSLHFSVDEWKHDIVENTASGRLLTRTPDGDVRVLVNGLRFANGVALAADESFVAVAQTADCSVLRYHLTGPRAGTSTNLIDGLPGYPDNMSSGSDGKIWVALATPVDPVLKLIWKLPLGVRRLVLRLPEKMQPAPKRTVRVLAFNEQGSIVEDRNLDAEHFHMATGVREHGGVCWVGSLEEASVAFFKL